MDTVQKLAKNTSSLFIAQIISSLLGSILAIFIARYLGDEQFGKYSFAIAFAAFYVIFSDLGYDTFIVREVPKNRSNAQKILSNVISIRIVLTLLFYALIVLSINLLGYPEDTKAIVYLFGYYSILTTFAHVFRMVFRAFEKMEYDALLNIITSMIKFSLGLLFLVLGFQLLDLGYIFVFVGIFEVVFGYIICRRKFLDPDLELDFGFWKKTIAIAFPICLASFFGLIYVKIDTVMLSFMKGDAVVGWYTAAYTLTLALSSFPDLFMNALLPTMSFYSATKTKKLEKLFEKSFSYLLIIGLPITVATTLLSDKIILFFYGQQYLNSIIALQILAWDIILLFLRRSMYYLLISVERQRQVMLISGCCALLNIVFNLILIPRYSYVGAGIATIATETLLLGFFYYLSSKYFYRISLRKIIIKPVIASGVMAGLIYVLSHFHLSLIIGLATLCYFMTLYLIKGISHEDINILKSIFRSRSK